VYYRLSIAQKLLRSASWTTGDRNIALLLAGLQTTIELSAQSSRSRLRRRQSSQRRRLSWVERRQRDALSVGVRKENAQKVVLGSLSLAMSQLEKCVWGQGGPAIKIARLLCTLAFWIMRHFFVNVKTTN